MATKPKSHSVPLSPNGAKFVQRKIDSGEFRSASDVIDESLRIMGTHEKAREEALSKLDAKIRSGLEQIKRGETVDGEEVWAEIEAKSKAARQTRKK
jgi:antitoxin ParD1/3/4